MNKDMGCGSSKAATAVKATSVNEPTVKPEEAKQTAVVAPAPAIAVSETVQKQRAEPPP
jgi:hypothetical protein